jgi:DNA-binding SARP family transcriptional activator/TolB-like protein
MSLRLTTFGGLAVAAADGGAPLASAAQRRRPLAVLAVLAAAAAQGGAVTRERLWALFWPESDADRARNALNQTVFALRRELGRPDLLLGTAELRLNPAAVASDVGDFAAARAAGDWARASALYAGPFLDGVHVAGAPEFERWADGERTRFAAAYATALEHLAAERTAAGDHAGAADCWRRRAAADPLSGRAAAAYMRALADAGDVAGALAHARIHAALVGGEVGVAPDPVVTRLATELRAATPSQAGPAVVAQPGAAFPVVAVDPKPPTPIGIPAAEPVAEALRATPAAASPSERRRLPHARRLALTVGICVFVVLSLAVTARRWAPSYLHAAPATESEAPIAVVPFRTDGVEAALRPLGHGVTDLLRTALTAPPTSRGDSGAVLSSPVVRVASGEDEVGVLRAARAAGAARVLGGALVGSARRLTIEASLTDARTGRVRAVARATGGVDSIAALAGRVAGELLARDAGEPPERVAALAGAGPVAVRAFLAGRAAFTGGQFSASQRGFATALREAPSLAVAAVWLAAAANWTGDEAAAGAAVARAWSARDALPAGERAYLVALAGPRYPAPSGSRERFTAWRAAARFAPDRPDVWNEVGEVYFHAAEWLALPRARANARLAFERALELDPAYQPARLHLVQLLVDAGDTAGARRQAMRLAAADSGGESALFARWLVARATRDERSARTLADRLAALPGQGARWLVEAAVDDAVGLDDAERGLAVRYRLAASNPERFDVLIARHTLMLARGRPAAAAAAVRDFQALEPEDALHARFHVRAALYDAGHLDVAGRAALALTPVATRLKADAARLRGATLDTVVKAACVVGQWRLARGDTAGARRLRAGLALHGRRAPEAAPEAHACRLLLDAGIAGRAGGRAVRDTLDALLGDGAPTGDVEPYLPLAVARAHLAAGDSARARDAVRRRSYFGRWPFYAGAQLALDARLSLAAGDTVGAVCALRHRAVLRAAPEPLLRADADTTYVLLTHLTRAWSTGARQARLAAAPLRAASCRTALEDT